MAKDKSKAGVPNKHLHARMSYLQQAATYLALQGLTSKERPVENDTPWRAKEKDGIEPTPTQASCAMPEPRQPTRTSSSQADKIGSSELSKPDFGGHPLLLSSHLTQVARKSQIRLSSSTKHTICKRCGAPLIEGQTSSQTMENLSKGGRKAHANVLVLKCTVCGATKRWPVGATRQLGKKKRKAAEQKPPPTSTSANEMIK